MDLCHQRCIAFRPYSNALRLDYKYNVCAPIRVILLCLFLRGRVLSGVDATYKALVAKTNRCHNPRSHSTGGGSFKRSTNSQRPIDRLCRVGVVRATSLCTIHKCICMTFGLLPRCVATIKHAVWPRALSANPRWIARHTQTGYNVSEPPHWNQECSRMVRWLPMHRHLLRACDSITKPCLGLANALNRHLD